MWVLCIEGESGVLSSNRIKRHCCCCLTETSIILTHSLNSLTGMFASALPSGPL